MSGKDATEQELPERGGDAPRGDAGSGALSLSRRLLLKGGLTTVGVSALTLWPGGRSTAAAQEAAPAGPGGPPAVGTSENGWPMEESIGPGFIQLRPVVGTDISVALRVGEVATVLIHVVRRFHYEIDALAAGQVDGFRPPPWSGARHESNHSSGTAVDIRRDWYPPGSAGGFTAGQLIVLRDILAECEGVVRWGGDRRRSIDENHFHIDVPPQDGRLMVLAERIKGAAAAGDQGAGTGAELPFTPERRRRALTLQRQQGPVD